MTVRAGGWGGHTKRPDSPTEPYKVFPPYVCKYQPGCFNGHRMKPNDDNSKLKLKYLLGISEGARGFDLTSRSNQAFVGLERMYKHVDPRWLDPSPESLLMFWCSYERAIYSSVDCYEYESISRSIIRLRFNAMTCVYSRLFMSQCCGGRSKRWQNLAQ